MTLTLSQLESIVMLNCPADAPSGNIAVGYPYGNLKVIISNNRLRTVPSRFREMPEFSFWVNTQQKNVESDFTKDHAVWEERGYTEGMEFRVTALQRVAVMRVTPKDNSYVTLSFRIFTNGNDTSVSVGNDGSSTEVEVTISGTQVWYLKADKVAYGASIGDSSYVDSWPGGANEITYSGTEERYVNISFNVETQIRWSLALDGYMNDVKSWVGDPSIWETYDDVVAACKQAWLDELNSLPLSLDTFDVNFYRVLTAWLGMIIDATPVQFNGYKKNGFIPQETPFIFILSNTNVYAHEFQGSLWDIGYGSFYLLGLLKPDKAEEFVEGMLALNEYYGVLSAYKNVMGGEADQGRDNVYDADGFFLIIAEALCLNLNLDWQSVFNLADSLMQDWRDNYLGGVTEQGYFPYGAGGTPNSNTMELIYFEYLLSFLASKVGDASKRDFYRGFAQNTDLLGSMYDASANRFRVPGSPSDWVETEALSDTMFWYYSYCSPELIEQVVDFDAYLSDIQYFLDYNNFYNDFQVAAPYLTFFHSRPDIAWKNINSLVFPSLNSQMTNYYSIWEDFQVPRTGDLYEKTGVGGYTTNHAQYILNYLGLYYIQGYPFVFIGVPQASYVIGSLHVVVEGSGEYVDTVEFNGFAWKSLKLPVNMKGLSGVLRVKLSSSSTAWRKSRFILPDNGYYAITSVIDRPLVRKFKFTVSSPLSETHTIRLYFEDTPRAVSGVESWSYDPANKTLSLTVKTLSETTVTVDYGESACPDLFSRILDKYGASASITRNQPVTTDDYGNPVENWISIGTENIIVHVLKAKERIELPGVFQEADAKGFLKPDSLAEPGDRLAFGENETYQVLAIVPRRLGGCLHHLEAALKRVAEEPS